MMVTFISQCQKNALKKTRRVLDAFADRIGDNAWQTVITEDGLITVKTMLRKTASKNTAVACHWIRSRSRSELVWVVGNKNQFDEMGRVAVHFTESDIDQYMDKSQWKTLEAIKYAAAIAGLFHDFGKANILFQNKLQPKKQRKNDSISYEPYRHEWVSLRLFQSFIGKQTTDQEWLDALSNINQTQSEECIKDGLIQGAFNHPINDLPAFAQLVAWLILTHHKLPLSPNWLDGVDSAPLQYINEWFDGEFNAIWNSYNCNDIKLESLVSDNWTFSKHGLPYQSEAWRYNARKIALKAISNVRHLADKDFLFDQVFTAHISRLCLMLADHYWSDDKRQKKDEWRAPNYEVFSNTYREAPRALKQQLDEHLIGVAFEAKKIALALPRFKNDLASLTQNNFLESDIPKNLAELKKQFGWQDDAKKLALTLSESTSQDGFFGINMASTGRGKTLANAKIMYALGNKTGRRRFSVALGLRTLTLQTGREYRTELDLNSEQLAIAVGGSAVKQLFENAENTKAQNADEIDTGSESQHDYLDADLYVDYQGELNYLHALSDWTKENDRIEKLIQAPVLVCTIDHLIPATEGTKGGKQIGPMLRLLTSDLVIDEPDDFGLEDLPALCRLVHWAGMLGSRVLLSTATIPPALTYAAFQAYKAGWEQFAKANLDGWNGEITCAWFDEENARGEQIADFLSYQKAHEKFVNTRIKHLKQNVALKHLADILPISNPNDKTTEQVVAQTVQSAAIVLHLHHSQEIANKTVSIGLVRMANINPLVAVAKELLKLDIEQADTRIHLCVYHSRFPLAIRSHLENKLDHFLKRNPKDGSWPPVELHEQLSQFPENNHIFIVIASPVAEVGRDHDYDWAIIEPSSIRSIIQIAGRVLRHRNIIPQHPNILLLDKNIKCLNGEDRCFDRPGFELAKLNLKMEKHALSYVLEDVPYQKLDSTLRIIEDSQFAGKEAINLVSLEHKALNKQLLESTGASVWWGVKPFWCGEVQKQQKFRDSPKDEAYHLFINSSDDELYWQRKNEAVTPYEWGVNNGVIEFKKDLEVSDFKSFWFNLSAVNIYKSLASELSKKIGNKMELKEVAEKFGEVRITEYKNKNYKYSYHELLGLYRGSDDA